MYKSCSLYLFSAFNPKTALDHSPKGIPALFVENNSSGSNLPASNRHKGNPVLSDGNLKEAKELQQLQRSFPLKQLVNQVHPQMTPRMISPRFRHASPWAGIHEEQERRKLFLHNFCGKYNSNHHSKLDLTEIVSRIYVEEKHKILYCEVPKAGCSNWKRTLMVLNGLAPSTDEISHNAVHYGRHLKKLDSFDSKGIHEHLNNFTKVVVVRDPMERLVSAFRDKFEQPNPYYHPVFGRAIIQKYRENATLEALRSGSGVTFREFVRYLLDAERPVGMDIHWEPI
ncbi:hypothetical protein MATL_G00034330 [Megalops atlanticus]|uniref:Carbohydrate sulfotransferase n=1 Tax=Megalops atlanticus TaxID=7932 RepID=A0A9D3QD76_MEGAT|nr:hypothetical protein MATL_G00034330 [Megalops atlanticus]